MILTITATAYLPNLFDEVNHHFANFCRLVILEGKDLLKHLTVHECVLCIDRTYLLGET